VFHEHCGALWREWARCFDKQPPFPALAAGTGGNFASATSLYFPGIIGRTYLLSASYHF
jgi:hypothetical protein